MDMRCCLADVARHELKVLMQDAEAAIYSLARQRESVIQAVEAAQSAHECPGEFPDETDLRIVELLDSVHRLSGALNEVVRELEQIEVDQLSPETSRPIPWPIWLDFPKETYRLALNEERTFSESPP